MQIIFIFSMTQKKKHNMLIKNYEQFMKNCGNGKPLHTSEVD